MQNLIRPIYIDKNEGIGSIVSRLEGVGEEKVALVFPPESFVFNNILEIQYLKREAQRLKKEIIVITSDKGQEELAKTFGFKVKSDIFEKEEEVDFLKDFYTKEGKEEKKEPITEEKTGEEEFKDFEEEAETKIKIKDIRKQAGTKAASIINFFWAIPSRFFKRIASLNLTSRLYLLAVMSLIILAFATTYVFSKAEVRIKPKKETLEFIEPIILRGDLKEPNFNQNILPLEIFAFVKERSQTSSATGEKDVSEKAFGKIKIYNEYSSNPQTLVRNTRFLSKEGKLFRLTKQTQIPGAKVEGGKLLPSFIEAEVIADQPGESFNIGPTEFSIPGFQGTDRYKKFYGRSQLPMAGGKTGRVSFIKKEDYDKTKELILGAIKEEVKKDLETNFPKDFGYFLETLDFKEISEEMDKKVGDFGNTFTLKIKVKGEIGGYKKSLVNSFIDSKAEITPDSKKISLPDLRTLNFEKVSYDKDLKIFKVNLKVKDIQVYNFKEHWLREALLQKTENEIKSFFSGYENEISQVTVNLWPIWIKKTPKDKERINVIIDYSQ